MALNTAAPLATRLIREVGRELAVSALTWVCTLRKLPSHGNRIFSAGAARPMFPTRRRRWAKWAIRFFRARESPGKCIPNIASVRYFTPATGIRRGYPRHACAGAFAAEGGQQGAPHPRPVRLIQNRKVGLSYNSYRGSFPSLCASQNSFLVVPLMCWRVSMR